MKVGEFIAHLFSIVLQPLLMPVYSVALLFGYTNFFDSFVGQELRFIIPIVLFSFMLPSFAIVMMRKFDIIKDYAMSLRQDRLLPYLVVCLSNSVLVYYFYYQSLYFWFLGLLAIPIFISLIGIVITLFWKISGHMMGIGGLIGGVFSVCFNVKALNPFLLFIILFILAGCLGVSSLYLKRHTPAQVYVGFIVGCLISYFSVWLGVWFMY